MMVPAHAVQVSVSVPVLVSGPLTPCFRFTCQSERKRKTLKLCFERRVWSCKRICMKTSRPRERLHRGAVTAASRAAKQKMETWSREVKECPEQTQVTVCCMWINANIYFVLHIKQNIFTKDSASLLFFSIAQTWIASMTASHMTCTLLTEQGASCCYPPSHRTSITPLFLKTTFGNLLWTFSAFNKRSNNARVGFWLYSCKKEFSQYKVLMALSWGIHQRIHTLLPYPPQSVARQKNSQSTQINHSSTGYMQHVS